MRAILIDPVRRSVSAIHYPGEYRKIYALLSDPDNGYNVDCFDIVYVDKRNTLFVDDSGLLKNPRHFFLWRGYDQPLAGRGLLLGADGAGETIATSWTAKQVVAQVYFTDDIRVLGMTTSEDKEQRYGQTFDVIRNVPVFGPAIDKERKR